MILPQSTAPPPTAPPFDEYPAVPGRPAPRPSGPDLTLHVQLLGHFLPNATCLMRPHSFYAWFVVSRIAIICYMIRQF